jgi:hypothetical protein
MKALGIMAYLLAILCVLVAAVIGAPAMAAIWIGDRLQAFSARRWPDGTARAPAEEEGEAAIPMWVGRQYRPHP